MHRVDLIAKTAPPFVDQIIHTAQDELLRQSVGLRGLIQRFDGLVGWWVGTWMDLRRDAFAPKWRAGRGESTK